MKKINLICMAALMLSACISEKDLETVPEPQAGPEKMTFNATLGEAPGTKLCLDDETGKLYWQIGDNIGIFTDDPSDTGSFFKMEGSGNASTATFSGELLSATSEYYYGVYPYGGSDSNWGAGIENGKIHLPLTNGCYCGTFQGGWIFGFQNSPHVLPNRGRSFPMVARSKDNNLHFYNVCGGLKIVVDTPNLIAVVIKNNDGSPLWGIMDISFDGEGKPVMEGISITERLLEELDDIEVKYSKPDEFWMMDSASDDNYFLIPGEPYYALLPPITFTQGMTVTFRTPSTYATYIVNGSFSIERSVFSRLTLRDKGLEFKPLEGNIVFENDGFKQYCVNNFDTNHDGEISFAEALEVTEININGTASTDAPSREDLMFFENLEMFVCRGTDKNPGALYRLDLDLMPKLKLIDCSYNNIDRMVDLSQNPDLQAVNLQYNAIPSLKLGDKPMLTTLALTDNNLTEIDVSGCPELQKLYLSGNKLESLDVSHNPQLIFLNCNYNSGIGTLDLSANPKLETLYGGGCGLSTLDVSKQPGLTTLYCWGNNLTSLDMSNNPDIAFLSCYSNNLTSLDIRHLKNLVRAFVSYNPLGSLDVTQNENLEILYCCINDLTTLDVTHNPALTNLRCFDNDLTELDLSRNPELKEVVFGGNPMELLDVSHNPKLYYFDAIYEEPYWRDEKLVRDIKYNTFTSPLKYIIIADGQSIPEVTYDRLDQTLPFATIVLTRSQYESGVHPHASLFGDYTMKAYTCVGDGQYEYSEWTASVNEYDSDQTKANLSWLSKITSLYQSQFAPSVDIYGVIAGDRSRIRIPLPQRTPCFWSDADSYWSMFLWSGELMDGRFTSDFGVVTFTLQGDGSYKADNQFGIAFEQGSFGIETYIRGYYYGQANFATDAYPILLIKQ